MGEDLQEIEDFVDNLQSELKDKQSKISELQNHTANSIFTQAQDPNLIIWQLELDNILERIEHLLRGDILQTDTEGNVIYVEPTDKNLIVLNDYGVKLIMNVISFYLNRNTILSNYDQERVYEILHNLGTELGDVIYQNYTEMGLDTQVKRTRYILMCMNIVHTIESAYNRALRGGERESLRSARVVTQSENPRADAMMQQYRPQKRGGFFNFLKP